MKPALLSRSMPGRIIWSAIVFLAPCLFPWQTLRADDQTINGSLGITGSVDVQGDTFSLGTQPNNTAVYGLLWEYQEDGNHVPTISLTSTRTSPVWLWQRLATGSSSNVPQMRLSGGNALTLFDQASPTPNAAIVLDPVAGSSFGSSVTLNGPDNRMANQQITGSGSVLTVGLADARYGYAVSGSSVAFGPGASANGNTATALGQGANAGGPGATALGENAGAGGFTAVALGVASRASSSLSVAIGNQATSSGNSSIALGALTAATGDYSMALGTSASATGWSATAVGQSAAASGDGASALARLAQAVGTSSTALGYSSIALGYESLSLGSDSGAAGSGSESLGYHSAAPGTGAAAVGNYSQASGSYATALSTAAVASGDYAVAAGRTAATSLYQCTVGAYGVTGGDPHQWVPTDALFTVANGPAANAPSNALVVQKNGNAMFQGVVTVAPGGDIPMYTGN